MAMRLLDADAVRAALPMQHAIDAMREAFAAISSGEADVPLRTHIDVAEGRGTTLTMSAALRSPVRFGSKLLTLFPENPKQGLPFIHGLVVMFDEETGSPSGLLEGMTLTAIRTGAASGLATDLLARPDSSRLAIIGSGTQARTQAEAVCCVRPIDRIVIYSRTQDRAARFAADLEAWFPSDVAVAIAASPAEAVDGAHVICTATSATDPLIGPSEVATGTHVNAIGSYTPEMQELDPQLLRNAKLYVDQRSAALAEAGEIIEAIRLGLVREDSLIELGELLTDARLGRERDDEVTVFKSVGLAVQDLCAAAGAVRRAAEQDLGVEVDM